MQLSPDHRLYRQFFMAVYVVVLVVVRPGMRQEKERSNVYP